MTKRTENYHGLKIPKLVGHLRDWSGWDQKIHDKFIDLKVEHESIMSLTDYQLGNFFDRHPQAKAEAAQA